MQNVAVLQQIWLYGIIGGTLPMSQNTTMRVNGAWIKRYCILCSKAYNTSHSCHNFPAGSRQAARGACICETSLLKHFHVLRRYTMWEKYHFCEYHFHIVPYLLHQSAYWVITTGLVAPYKNTWNAMVFSVSVQLKNNPRKLWFYLTAQWSLAIITR